jgi:hypothetical protein
MATAIPMGGGNRERRVDSINTTGGFFVWRLVSIRSWKAVKDLVTIRDQIVV